VGITKEGEKMKKKRRVNPKVTLGKPSGYAELLGSEPLCVTSSTYWDGEQSITTVSLTAGSCLDKCLYQAKPVALDTVKLLLNTGALRRMK
jgi:hypothetical protein